MAKTIYSYEHRFKKKTNNFENDFFKLMNNAVFKKTMDNVRKLRENKLVITETRRNYSVSEANYHATKCSTEHLLAIETEKLTYLRINLSI